MNSFLSHYAGEINRAMAAVDPAVFERAVTLLAEAYRDHKQVFVIGNGGSAATANHFACDFGKNAVQDPAQPRFRVLSLSESVEKITAWGNDVAFEEIFRQQLVNLMDEGDLIIVISASGNSPDLVRACEYAREKRARVITMSGFDGGKISAFADAAFVIPLTSYERIEDMHSILNHAFVCCFKERPELTRRERSHE